MKAVRIFITLIAAGVLIIAIFTAAIYVFGIDNNRTRAFNRNFSLLPAAMINGKFVFLAEVEKRLAMYESAVRYQSNAGELDLKKNHGAILDALIEQHIIADIAAKKNLGVRQSELDEYFRYISSNFNGTFEDAFDVSSDMFKNLITKPELMAKKLQTSLYAEATDSKEFQRARKIKALLDEGLAFGASAQTYSEDEKSKYISGDLGFKTADELGPWLAKSALSLQGTTTSEVIVSPEGYHIIRVTSHDTSITPPKYQVQQILIRGFDFEEYLEKQRKNYRIYTLVRV